MRSRPRRTFSSTRRRGFRLQWRGRQSRAHHHAKRRPNFVGDQSTNRVFENFVVPDATGWHVRQIWSSGFNVSANSVVQAEWSIRTGMAPGSAGSIVAEDISPATQSPTGRACVVPSLNEPEYALRVSGLDLVLPPGEYWLNVTPLTGLGQFALSVTTSAGGVGAPIGDAETALWWWS